MMTHRHVFGRIARRGFTLIEVLATLVLLGIVMPVAMRGVSLALAASSIARLAKMVSTPFHCHMYVTRTRAIVSTGC